MTAQRRAQWVSRKYADIQWMSAPANARAFGAGWGPG